MGKKGNPNERTLTVQRMRESEREEERERKFVCHSTAFKLLFLHFFSFYRNIFIFGYEIVFFFKKTNKPKPDPIARHGKNLKGEF